MALFNGIAPFVVPTERDPGDWGTVDGSLAAELQDRLDVAINELRLLGLQVSLRDGEKKTWTGASGTIDLRRREPLTCSHVMRVASTTKLFTSVAVLSLVEGGSLALDDTLDRWFPTFPQADRITIAMLLSHTSGIGHPPFTFGVKWRLLFSKRPFTLDELIDLAAATEPYDEPGRSHQYSNANHHLLGVVAERVTGEPVSALLERAVFAKLGTQRTALLPYQPVPADLISGWDNLYTPSLRPYEVRADNVMLASHAATSGGMVATAGELRMFIDGVFDGLLLEGDLVEQMAEMSPCDVPEFRHTGVGLGLFRIRVGGGEYLGHLGLFVGSAALLLRDPGSGGTIAVIGNLSESRVFDVAERFVDIIR